MPSTPKCRARYLSVDWNAVGRRIGELRAYEATQEEFAYRVGIGQNYLSNIERDKAEVGAEILTENCREFDKSIEWLLTGENTAQK